MQISDLRAITGPNIYSHRPVLMMTLHLEALTNRRSREFSTFNRRLFALLPGLKEHSCDRGWSKGFVERIKNGAYFGLIVEHVAHELMSLTGIATDYRKTQSAGSAGVYNIIFEYKAEEGAKFLLRTAVELVDALVERKEYDLAAKLKEARRVIAHTELGPSTRAIVNAAESRNIPWMRIGNGSLIQLGYGQHRRFIQSAMTNQTSAIGVDVASDKELTKVLLRNASLPVPQGSVVDSEEAALAAFNDIGLPVVIKPYNGCQGKGVCLNLKTEEQVRQAFRIAQKFSSQVLVEELLQGRDYRVLVVNGKVVAASERVPAHVVGDGQHTIAELIEIVNQDPERGDGHEKSLTKIVVDDVVSENLSKQGLNPERRPAKGQRILLRECANLSTGGTASDVTDIIHPDVAEMCERAARIIGLDVCGLDLILNDIAQPLSPGNGIVEINAAPGLRMHTNPSEGASRDVGRAIIESLYPANAPSRIPIVSVTGTNGKTTITRMIAHAIGATGRTVGMTSTDGIYLGQMCLMKGDTTGPRSARTILSDPAVEVAVLETARGGIVRGGLAYDWSDVAVLSNVRLDHLGQDNINSLDDLLYIKSLVAERVREGGTLILNADDERLAQLTENPRIKKLERKIVYFSLHPIHLTIRRHLSAGGTAFFYDHGWIVEAQGANYERIMRASEMPVTMGGTCSFQIANALAAFAACRAQGVAHEVLVKAFKSFRAEQHNRGRANLYRVVNGYVLVDYGHNPDAFESVCRMATHWEGRRVTGVIGVPGDRNNEVVAQAGRIAAQGFHRLIIKEDIDLRGRQKGEIADLLYRAAKQAAPQSECRIIHKEIDALRIALDEMQRDEIVVVFFEKFEPIQKVLVEYGATPADRIPDIASRATQKKRRVSVVNGRRMEL